jgi:hypothetical protein
MQLQWKVASSSQQEQGEMRPLPMEEVPTVLFGRLAKTSLLVRRQNGRHMQ